MNSIRQNTARRARKIDAQRKQRHVSVFVSRVKWPFADVSHIMFFEMQCHRRFAAWQWEVRDFVWNIPRLDELRSLNPFQSKP